MPPLFRIDAGKRVFYALDEAEKNGILDRLIAEGSRAKPQVTRFKGLGEMNPLQLRETTMARDTRRLVQLTLDDDVAGEINAADLLMRSEEHTSELQSLMRISYAVFCLKKKNKKSTKENIQTTTASI